MTCWIRSFPCGLFLGSLENRVHPRILRRSLVTWCFLAEGGPSREVGMGLQSAHEAGPGEDTWLCGYNCLGTAPSIFCGPPSSTCFLVEEL